MQLSADQLCSTCAQVDTTFFDQSITETIGKKPTDILWSVLKPEFCRFCRLLSFCLRSGNDPCLSVIEPGCNLRGSYVFKELQLQVEREGNSVKLRHGIRGCSSNTAALLGEGIHRNPEQFNIDELRLWLTACNSHANCTAGDLAGKSLPEGFRLVDVQDYAIVPAKDIRGKARYCALSYVWGGVEQLNLTSSNCRNLEEKNSLRDQKLPKTILDAIHLCQQIDCRYLWVDSLCIIQDCNKHEQIQAMDTIYSHTFLTIIAAAGSNADAGIPPFGSLRYKSNETLMVQQTSKGSFISCLSPQIASAAIENTKWASRGWTLQEYALSRRVLFLTGSYVFFRCAKRLLCEDFGYGMIGFSNSFDESIEWDLPLPPFYRQDPDPRRHYSKSFTLILSEFVGRHLSFENDILAAFTGILIRMEWSIGAHIWGLPTRQFGAALQWTTRMPCPSKRRVGFPSWSWTGWIHSKEASTFAKRGIHDVYAGFDNCATDISVVSCYDAGTNNIIRTVEECSHRGIITAVRSVLKTKDKKDNLDVKVLEGLLRHHFTPVSSYQEIIQSYLAGKTRPDLPISHYIFIWSSCAVLYVDHSPALTDSSAVVDFQIRPCKDSPAIGSIQLCPKWRSTQPDYMLFFASTIGVHDDLSDADQSLRVKLSVILIQPEVGTKPMAYRRIQVSHRRISMEDWIQLGPKSRLFALV